MAKARIKYEVDKKQLDQVQKELKEIQGENKKVEESFAGTNKEIGKSKSSLGDLKSAVASVGLAAMAGAALVEFAKLTQEINKNRKEVAQLTNATGLALDKITAKVRATSQVFEKDFNEVLRAANTVSKEFGVSMNEALDEINEGFTRGLDVNGQYLDTLSEYSTFIKEAGLNTRQFNVLIQQQVQQGIFSDKGIDAIKEAVISLREMTPATRDAIKAIGINTDELINDIQSGTKTYFEAVQEIATKTKELADPTKTGTILADVFRGAGEDAGNFIFTLDQVGEQYGDLTDEQEKYRQSTNDLLQSQESLDAAMVSFSKTFAGVDNQFRSFLNEAGAGTLRLIEDLFNGFDNVDKKTKSLKDSFQTLSESELRGELEKLEATSTKLNDQIERIEGREQTVFEKWFGGPNVAKKAREDLDDVKLQMSVINSLLTATNADTPIEIIEEPQVKRITEAATKTKELIDLRKQDLEEKKSEFIEEVEAKAEQNEILKNQEKKLSDDLKEINDQRRENELQSEQESQEEKLELVANFAQGISDIVSGFADLRIQQIQQEIQTVEFARNRELQLAEGNKEKEAEINKKYDAQSAVLRNKQLEAEKRSKVFESVIATALAVAKALPNIPLSILAGSLGAAQTAFILAQPIPKFAKGVIDLMGAGTGTSDTIPAYLSRGESVMTAEETANYKPTLKAIRMGEIAPEVLNSIAMNKNVQPNITINDYDKLAEAILNQPQKNVIIDKNGFTGHIISKSQYMRIKQEKYKF